MDRPERIKTTRLELHLLQDKDETEMMGMLQNATIKKTFMIPDFKNEDEARQCFLRLLAWSKDPEHLLYGIYFHDSCIGFIKDVEILFPTLEVGYVIDPNYHNQGYATEALQAYINLCFSLGFTSVTAGYFEENPASGRVMEKAGMHPVDKQEMIQYQGKNHTCKYCESTKKS